MARRRFKPDPDFQMVVSRAVSGVGFEGRSATRRRRTTLEFVAQEIIREAQDAVDRLPPEGLPGYIKGGRRNFNSDFRRREQEPGGGKPGATYRSSFGYYVTQERGRLIFVVFNNHPHAQEVESGVGGLVRSRGTGYFAIPITKRKYAQLIKRTSVLTSAQRQRRNDRSALSYWRRRERTLRTRRETNRRLARRRAGNMNANARVSTSQIIDRANRNARAINRARSSISALESKLGDAIMPHSFPVLAPNGKTYLYTQSFRTYGGYAILRHAMRRVTLKTLE